MNRGDGITSVSVRRRNVFLLFTIACLRRPGSHVLFLTLIMLVLAVMLMLASYVGLSEVAWPLNMNKFSNLSPKHQGSVVQRRILISA